MNKFDKIFFKKYVPNGQEILWIIHEHFIVILDKLLIWLALWVFIPAMLFYMSDRVREIPFIFLEIWLYIVFFKLIYDIFNRYNDVWIITDSAVIDLDWELFWSDNVSVKFSSIEWLEVEQNWIIDTMFWKWNLIVHKIWSDNFVLENANKPYDAIDIIENISQWRIWEDWNLDSYEEEKPTENFDLVMEALSWVVEDYLDKKWIKKKTDEKAEEIIEEVSEKQWTIDLR